MTPCVLHGWGTGATHQESYLLGITIHVRLRRSKRERQPSVECPGKTQVCSRCTNGYWAGISGICTPTRRTRVSLRHLASGFSTQSHTVGLRRVSELLCLESPGTAGNPVAISRCLRIAPSAVNYAGTLRRFVAP